MNSVDIAHWRLHNQRIAHAACTTPGEVVGWLGAVQAQDYLGALWAVGLRMRDTTETAIEQAIADKIIIRTWPMRGTLHFVAAADVRWMLALMTPRVIARSASRYRQLELDETVLGHSRDILIDALQGGKQLTRNALYQCLEAAQVPTTGQRGIHILGYHAQAGLLCFGKREGKQPTFVLLDEWAPHAQPMDREAALAELTRRYFTGHGPATVQDCMWWSGLTATEVRAGLAMVKTHLIQTTVDDRTYWMSAEASATPTDMPDVYLLPGFDEYLLGYQDRSAVLNVLHKQRINPGSNGMFSPTIVSDGRVVGTWKRAFKKGGVVITPDAFAPLNEAEQYALTAAAHAYGRFLELPAILA